MIFQIILVIVVQKGLNPGMWDWFVETLFLTNWRGHTGRLLLAVFSVQRQMLLYGQFLINKFPNPREEHKILRDVLKTCRHPEWSFVTSTENTNNTDSENKNKHNNIAPYMSELSDKLGRILNKYHILWFFKS